MVNTHMTLADIEKLLVKSKLVTPQMKAAWKAQLDSTGHLLCEKTKCTFETWSIDEMKKHYKQCQPASGPLFLCKLCKYGPKNRDTVIQHIIGEHNSIESYNDYDVSCSESDYKSTMNDASSSSDCSSGVDESEIFAQENHYVPSTDLEDDEMNSTKSSRSSSRPKSSIVPETYSFDKKGMREKIGFSFLKLIKIFFTSFK